MKKFTNPYDISKTIISLDNLKFIDPGTAITNTGDYLTLSNYSIKRVASLLNMGSGMFTKKLYSLEPSIWTQFLNQRLSLVDIKSILSHNNAVVIEDTLVSVSEGDNYVENVVSSINKYISDENLTTSYFLYDKELLVVSSVNSEGFGVLIRYYYQDNWVVINDCHYDINKRTLLVSPYEELNTKVGDDISILMDKDTIMNIATQTMPYNVESYRSLMREIPMSVDEVTYFMKKIFKIRMGIEPINMLDYAADHDDISAKILSKLEAINNKFYSNADSVQVVNAPYLKKAITSSAVTFADFSDLFETMFLEENERLHISILLDFQRKVLNHETHYDSLLG